MQLGSKYNKNKKYEAYASLTLEASLGLTVFVFLIVCLVMPMKMLDTQRKIQVTLETITKEMSRYAYIKYRMAQGEGELESGSDGSLANLFTGAAVKLYAEKKIRGAVGEKIEGLDLSSSKVTEDGEKIDLCAEYRLRLPFRFFTLDSVPAVCRSFRRGWIGSDGGRQGAGKSDKDEKDQMVYVGNSMGRYHWFSDCHYISNQISSVSLSDLGNQKNSAGKHYKPCSYCGKNASGSGTVYILPAGEYYHSRKECSSLAFYVRKVPLSEVEYLGECSYCRRMKGNG